MNTLKSNRFIPPKMNKPFVLALMGSALCWTPIQAQADHTRYPIKGTVCDSVSRQPEAFAPIRLLQTGNKRVVTATQTDVQGKFVLQAPAPGNYTLEAVVTGKRPLRHQLLVEENMPKGLTLDTLLTAEYTNSLNTATITAQKVMVKADIDKITYEAADDPETMSKSTLEILRKVPMVTVDGDDKIKVNGNASFKVYVNGKPNQMMSSDPSTVLKAYPAANIEKIEVITNPGAKYDAEGTAGVLNIITKKQTALSGYQVMPAFQIGLRQMFGGFWATLAFGKFSLSANYAGGKAWNMDYQNKLERETFDDAVNHLWKNERNVQQHNANHMGQLEASYEITPKDLLNVSAGFYKYKHTKNILTDARMLDATELLRYGYKINGKERYSSFGMNSSVDYQHQFSPQQHLTLSYRLDHSPNEMHRTDYYQPLTESVTALQLEDRRVNPDNLSSEHTAQADFSTQIAQKHDLSVGLKYIYRLNRSNYSEWTRQAGSEQDFGAANSQSLRYRHHSNIGAAYAEYILRLNKWSLQTGNRVEMFRATVNYPDGKRPGFNSTRTNWVPQVAVAFKPGTTSQLRANYNLRLNRPNIDILSPHQLWITPEQVSYGNPELSNTTTHNLGLNYSLFKPGFSLNTSLTYAFSNNEVVSYSFLDGNTQHTTYGNFLHSKQTTLSVYMQGKLSKTTNFSLNTTGTYSDFKSKVTNEENSGVNAHISCNVEQQLPGSLRLILWGGGGSRGIQLQGKGSNYYYYGLTLTWETLKEKRLGIQLAAHNFAQKHQRNFTTTRTQQFVLRNIDRYEPWNVNITLRYRLGTLKEGMKKVRKSIENTDVRSTNNNQQQGMGSM